jgi:hypothetical protein
VAVVIRSVTACLILQRTKTLTVSWLYISYGKYLRVLEGPGDHRAALKRLLQQTGGFLKTKHRSVDSPLCMPANDIKSPVW